MHITHGAVYVLELSLIKKVKLGQSVDGITIYTNISYFSLNHVKILLLQKSSIMQAMLRP